MFVSGRARGILASVALVAALGGCGGDAPAPAAAGKGPKKAASDPASKERRKKIDEAVATVGKALTSDPLSYDRTVADCERYQREAQEAGLPDVVAKLESMKKEAREAFEKAAEKETKEACEQARKYAAEGDSKKARNRLNGLHKNIHKDDRYWSQAQKTLEDVSRVERADRYYANVTKAKVDMFKRIEDWERAQGVLEAFLAIPAFAASPRSKDVTAALAEVKPNVEKVKAARATEQKIRWVPAFKGSNDDLFHWELADHGSVQVSGEMATFKHANEDSSWLSMMYGQDDWEDYIVEIQFRVDREFAFVNFRGYMEGEGDDRSRNWQEGAKLSTADFKDKDRFYKVRFEVRAGELRWSPPGASAPTTKKLKGPKGPFEIRIPKGGQITLKSVWVKVLKPAGGAPDK